MQEVWDYVVRDVLTAASVVVVGLFSGWFWTKTVVGVVRWARKNPEPSEFTKLVLKVVRETPLDKVVIIKSQSTTPQVKFPGGLAVYTGGVIHENDVCVLGVSFGNAIPRRETLLIRAEARRRMEERESHDREESFRKARESLSGKV